LHGERGPPLAQVRHPRVEARLGAAGVLGGGIRGHRSDRHDQGESGRYSLHQVLKAPDPGLGVRTGSPGPSSVSAGCFLASIEALRAFFRSPAALAFSMAVTQPSSNFFPTRNRKRARAASKVIAFE